MSLAGILAAFCLSLSACNAEPDGAPAQGSANAAAPAEQPGGRPISAQDITGDYLADPGKGENWPSEGNGYANNRYSALDSLNAETLADFGMLWSAPLAEGEGPRGTPIAVDSRIYYGDAVLGVAAWDAVSGQRLWNYNPDISAAAPLDPECASRAASGVALARGRIFFGQRDGRLTALDASTGAVLWSSQVADNATETIAGVPLVVGNRVIVGSARPCDTQVAAGQPRGHVSAYVAQDGNLDWRFHTVPTAEQIQAALTQPQGALLAEAARSWHPLLPGIEPGGGFVPGNIAFDSRSGDLLFGTGMRLPQAAGHVEGRGLFTSSLIALDPATGRYRWHRQLAPGGVGWSANAPILFANLPMSGHADTGNGDPAAAESVARRVRAAWLPLENGWLIAATEAAGYLGYSARYGGGYSPVESYDGETRTATLADDAATRAAEAVHSRDEAASYSPQTGLFYLHRSRIGRTADEVEPEGLVAFSPGTKQVAWEVEGAGPAPLVTAGGLLFARYRTPFGPGLGVFDAREGTLLYFRADIVPTGGFASFLAGGRQVVAFPALVGGTARMVTMGAGGRARLTD